MVAALLSDHRLRKVTKYWRLHMLHSSIQLQQVLWWVKMLMASSSKKLTVSHPQAIPPPKHLMTLETGLVTIPQAIPRPPPKQLLTLTKTANPRVLEDGLSSSSLVFSSSPLSTSSAPTSRETLLSSRTWSRETKNKDLESTERINQLI